MRKGLAAGGLLALAYAAFISLGLPDGLLGVAWPTMRTGFAVPLDALGQLLAASTAGYLVSSFFSGRLVARFGVGRILAASCGLTGLVLASLTLLPSWWPVLIFGIGLGLGAGAVDAGLNIHIASHFGPRPMQWLHACYGIGVTAGPLIMTAGLQRFISWKPGYLLVGALQIVLAVCFAFSIRIWDIPSTKNRTARIRHRAAPILETLRTPRVLMSMLLFFLYTGIEASLGFWVYSLLTQSRGIPSAIAGFWAGGYWAFFTVGRIAAGFFASRVRIHSIVIGSLCLILAGSIALWWDPSSTISLGAIILIGLAAAPVFPSMVSGTKNRVGTRYASNTVGMQMTAAGLGMAFLPGFAGFLAERFSLEILPGYLTALCLLLIACYSFFMFNEKSWNVRNTPARSLNRKT